MHGVEPLVLDLVEARAKPCGGERSELEPLHASDEATLRVADPARAAPAPASRGPAVDEQKLHQGSAAVERGEPQAPDARGELERRLGRLLAGEAATVMMTDVRGASNTKAKLELGWRPSHASWREGFARGAA